MCGGTPRPKSKGPNRGTPPVSPAKTDSKSPDIKLTVKGNQSQWGLRSLRSMMRLSKDSMTMRPQQSEKGARLLLKLVPVSDEYYAMMDSGTHAIIVRLHPDTCGELAECKVPSATVEGLLVQFSSIKVSDVWLWPYPSWQSSSLRSGSPL